LPEWFIKLFTKEGDWVLDPFVGSGTTTRVANRLKRNSIGIDISKDYYEMVSDEANSYKGMLLFERQARYGKYRK
jgi:DNA modification methylase